MCITGEALSSECVSYDWVISDTRLCLHAFLNISEEASELHTETEILTKERLFYEIWELGAGLFANSKS